MEEGTFIQFKRDFVVGEGQEDLVDTFEMFLNRIGNILTSCT